MRGEAVEMGALGGSVQGMATLAGWGMAWGGSSGGSSQGSPAMCVLLCLSAIS